MSDLIVREDAIKDFADYLREVDLLKCDGRLYPMEHYLKKAERHMKRIPSARQKGHWIPCSERLPKIGERVLLATNCGTVVIGHRDKPDLIWQVTEKGDKHWVYDPEAYTDDVDSLPKGEDCAFSQDTDYGDGFLSVTSLNYNPRFEGVIAWMPLPEPWRGCGT